MNFQSLKEYTRLNLQRSGLKLSEEDRAKAASMKEKIRKISEADHVYAAFDYEVRDMRIERFCYSSMSLSYWALIVCMSMLGLLLDEYLETGVLTITTDFTWAFYILPAVFLVGRLFLFSFVNIAHLVLLVLCALMSFLKIRIFGTEMNWMWVFIAVGTVITLVGRLWEGSHRMKENRQWYQENVRILKDGEKAIEEAAPVFTSIGAKAESEMRRIFPGVTHTEREPWFVFKRKLSFTQRGKGADLCELILPVLPNSPTDFRTLKESCVQTKQNDRRTVQTRIEISGQRMGYETIDKDQALSVYIQSGKVRPFFGMAVPEHVDGLQYEVYVHHWNAAYSTVTQNHFVDRKYVKSQTKQQSEWDLETAEWHHLGTSAENSMLHADSAAEMYQTQQYLDKKKRFLDSIPDHDVIEKYNDDRSEKSNYASFHEVAALSVTTPDGALVGLYCGESREAISFTQRIAESHWGAKLNPAAAPSSQVQKAYLYHCCL